MILVIVALGAFCGDFGSGAGISTIGLQGEEWDMSPNKVTYAGNLNVVILGIGGFTLGCYLTQDFTSFYGLRALVGFTLTACQTIGLSFIKDMFYFHETTRKIGIWACLFLLAPYFGPFFGNFTIPGTGDWRAVFWLVFAVCCLELVLIILFADETWYDRKLGQRPARGNRMLRLVGIWQICHHRSAGFYSIFKSLERLTAVPFKPTMIPTMLYYMLSFMWAVDINITSSILLATPKAEGGYGFGAKGIGFLYFTPLVAVSIGDAFGYFFNDFVASRYIRKHEGVFEPEAHLKTNYVAAFFMIPGLIIVGQALGKHLNYSAIIIRWGIHVFGVMIASVAVTAYALDCYPSASGEVSGYLNFARTIGGFAVGYFQQPWDIKDGFSVSFGIQAAIVAVALVVLICLQVFGAKMRAKG